MFFHFMFPFAGPSFFVDISVDILGANVFCFAFLPIILAA